MLELPSAGGPLDDVPLVVVVAVDVDAVVAVVTPLVLSDVDGEPVASDDPVVPAPSSPESSDPQAAINTNATRPRRIPYRRTTSPDRDEVEANLDVLGGLSRGLVTVVVVSRARPWAFVVVTVVVGQRFSAGERGIGI